MLNWLLLFLRSVSSPKLELGLNWHFKCADLFLNILKDSYYLMIDEDEVDYTPASIDKLILLVELTIQRDKHPKHPL